MLTWTLTTETADRTPEIRTGAASGRDDAVAGLVAATREAVITSPPGTYPRHRLELDGDLIAIIGTGEDTLGKPDRDAALDHIDRIHTTLIADDAELSIP